MPTAQAAIRCTGHLKDLPKAQCSRQGGHVKFLAKYSKTGMYFPPSCILERCQHHKDMGPTQFEPRFSAPSAPATPAAPAAPRFSQISSAKSSQRSQRRLSQRLSSQNIPAPSPTIVDSVEHDDVPDDNVDNGDDSEDDGDGHFESAFSPLNILQEQGHMLHSSQRKSTPGTSFRTTPPRTIPSSREVSASKITPSNSNNNTSSKGLADTFLSLPRDAENKAIGTRLTEARSCQIQGSIPVRQQVHSLLTPLGRKLPMQRRVDVLTAGVMSGIERLDLNDASTMRLAERWVQHEEKLTGMQGRVDSVEERLKKGGL
ncbi:hypothetical protein P280DRAFT_511157 [Massarina eburnea CBS 473.64]|uniref:Uncharacterized protein n=1 Tax=Massarina eburnea CBS 473.64 TaxID=1395130 RepID=A0A6A6RK50_9PLEO|nr:hypothetical protein P280DRAFT_511157 [Massarina eburnea CBS 473.64]